MKILLISPPIWNISGGLLSTSPPLGLMYLGAVLDLKGHKVKIIDADAESLKLTWSQLSDKIKKEQPDIVGLASTSLGLPALFKSADIVKEAGPDILVVAGGYGPTLEAEKILKEHKSIDVVMMGEGEETIIELVDIVQKKESLDRIKGIAYRQKERVIINEPRPEIGDLDSIPFPAYHLLEPHYLTYEGVHGKILKLPNAVMMASRGCPHRCIFCSIKMARPRFLATVLAGVFFLPRHVSL